MNKNETIKVEHLDNVSLELFNNIPPLNKGTVNILSKNEFEVIYENEYGQKQDVYTCDDINNIFEYTVLISQTLRFLDIELDEEQQGQLIEDIKKVFKEED